MSEADLAGPLLHERFPFLFRQNDPVSCNPYFAAVNLVSSLGSNVQNALIQREVGIVSQKLDIVLSQCAKIANSLEVLPQIQALSWVGTAFSLANTGISIVGFYATLTKLNGVNKLIQDFYKRIQ